MFSTKRYKFKNRNAILFSFIALVGIIVITGVFGATSTTRLLELSKKTKNGFLPAMDVLQISEKLYSNRLRVEKHILIKNTAEYKKIEKNIYHSNKEIDSLINTYSDYYSNSNEFKDLRQYRGKLQQYRRIEQQVLGLSRKDEKQQAIVIFIGQSAEQFYELTNPLDTLAKEHQNEGIKAYQDSEDLASFIRLFLYLSVALALGITIVIGTIIAFSYLGD